MGYEVVRYAEDLKDDVLALLAHVWGSDRERNAANFVWKFEQNPYLDRPLLHLVRHHGRVVAMRAVHGAHWLRGTGTPIRALGTGDFVIDPAHRGRHLFGRIMTAAVADVRALGYRYLINLSASPATYLQSIRAGWADLGALAVLHQGSATARFERLSRRAVARHAPVARLARRVAASALARWVTGRQPPDLRFRALEGGIAAAGARSGLHLVVSGQPRPEAMAELIARGPVASRIRHARDAAYLAWRFRNPLAIYRFVYCGRDGLDGFVALGTRDDPVQDAVRVVLCEAREPRSRQALLQAVIGAGRFRDLSAWSGGAGPDERHALHALGFRGTTATDARHRAALLAIDLDGGASPAGILPEIAAWNLSMVDSDAY